MYQIIAAPFLGESFLVLKPGSERGMRISAGRYEQLRDLSARGEPVPDWLLNVCAARWGIPLSSSLLNEVAVVRQPSAFGYGRASWELNLGCKNDCEHCYLDTKRFEGLSWDQRLDLLHILRDAGVVWLQLTGGEPLIDRLFAKTYAYAWDLGMMISISTNASCLWKSEILDLLRDRPALAALTGAEATTAL